MIEPKENQVWMPKDRLKGDIVIKSVYNGRVRTLYSEYPLSTIITHYEFNAERTIKYLETMQKEIAEKLEELKNSRTYVRKFVIEVEVKASLKDAELYQIEEQQKASFYDPEFNSGVIRYELKEVT
jgi:hypothetical protein